MGVKIEKTTISCGFLASMIGVEPTAFRLGVGTLIFIGVNGIQTPLIVVKPQSHLRL